MLKATMQNDDVDRETYKKIEKLLVKIDSNKKLIAEETDYLNDKLWGDASDCLYITLSIEERKPTKGNKFNPFYVNDSNVIRCSDKILASLIDLVFDEDKNKKVRANCLHAIAHACWPKDEEEKIQNSMIIFFEYIFRDEEEVFSDSIRKEAVYGLSQFLAKPELAERMQFIKKEMLELNLANRSWKLRRAIVEAIFDHDPPFGQVEIEELSKRLQFEKNQSNSFEADQVIWVINNIFKNITQHKLIADFEKIRINSSFFNSNCRVKINDKIFELHEEFITARSPGLLNLQP